MRSRPLLCTLLTLASLCAALVSSGSSVANATVNTAPPATWVTNGRVDAVVPSGSRDYLAGSFTLVGPNTGLAGVVDAGTGAVSASWGLAGGSVLAAASDGNGGWFIGGSFTVASGVRQANAAHVLADGTLDQTWNPRPNNTVRAIAYDAASHTVFLGGDFSNVHSQPNAYAAAVDDVTGTAVPGFSLTPDGSVLALATDPVDGHLFLGGDFHNVDGASRVGLAAVSMTDGSLAPFATAATNGEVRALSLSTTGDRVFVGGSFTTLGGVASPRLAAISTSTGSAVSGFAPMPNAPVDALLPAADGVGLYVGGEFTAISGVSSPLLARIAQPTGTFDPSFAPAFTTACTPPNPDTTCTAGVRALQPGASGATIDVGGAFLTVHGLTRNNAAELGTDGTPTSWNPVANGPVDALGQNTGTGSVLIGGELSSLNAIAVSNLAALSRSTGALDPTWNASANGSVLAMVVSADGSQLYLGGTFTSVNGVARAELAKVGTSAGALDPTFHPATSKSVEALALYGSKLFVGGTFSTLAGMSTKYLGLVDATTGVGNPAFAPAPNGIVEALGLTSTGNSVWVGGSYTTIGGRTAAGLEAVSSTTGVASSWAPSPRPSRVMAISAVPGTVCIGSRSNQVGCYNTTTGKASVYVKNDGNVQAVAIAGSTVYAGGHFNVTHLTTGDVARRKLESFDLGTGALQTWAPTINSALGVFAIAPATEGLLVGGDFTEISSVQQQGIALLPGTA